jgi:GDPmannose 4,6-dehydratase
MWAMLQQPEPDDYVIGTGESHSVKDFVEAAFRAVGLDWKQYVEIDERYYRPSEVEDLIADAAKARKKLGWEPKIGFEGLVKIMMKHDLIASGLTAEAQKIK